MAVRRRGSTRSRQLLPAAPLGEAARDRLPDLWLASEEASYVTGTALMAEARIDVLALVELEHGRGVELRVAEVGEASGTASAPRSSSA